MKAFLTLLLLSFGLSSSAQTHLTVNKEKCWIIREFTNHMGDTLVTVVVESGEMENERQRVEQILKWKNKLTVENRLAADGFRVEIFYRRDLSLIKRKHL